MNSIDWFDPAEMVAIVLAAWILAGLYAGGVTGRWLRRNAETVRTVAHGPEPLDHVLCANPDCGQTICYCRTDVECDDCSVPGCAHHEFLCWECRVCCDDCLVDIHMDQAMDLAREDGVW